MGTGIISEAGFRIQFEYETTTGGVLKCKSTQDQSFQIFSEDAQWKMAIGENMTAIFRPYSVKLTTKKKPRNKSKTGFGAFKKKVNKWSKEKQRVPSMTGLICGTPRISEVDLSD